MPRIAIVISFLAGCANGFSGEQLLLGYGRERWAQSYGTRGGAKNFGNHCYKFI
jgi:hypothetical protein